MIDNLYRKRVSEKNAVNCSKIVQILHAHNFVIFNLCNDWRICSIECSVRFTHTAHVCRWRSKLNRAVVKGNWHVFVGHNGEYVSNYIVCWTRN